ncbi:hypothetical protein ES332_A04G000100v1 [Gossypium tomentosum]|uniref:Lariat debranching enzyme C-terminal domain-containing protein n=1 Tax=Gossypium tomentosum TaxID=34277 RepID=A0A5D2QSV5_GOSTO|nr:hypothetical protein ES332_A04G000100v1 [Gossypium tomentosum]
MAGNNTEIKLCLSFDLPTWRRWVGEQSSTCKTVVNGLRAGWKTDEPNFVNFLKQLHLTNPLILTFSGSPRNPQIVSFLELLDLPYVLDNASDSRDTPSSLPQKDDYSEDIPNEDEDDLEDDAEWNNENRFS